MIKITLTGENPDRYFIECSEDVIGRRYDNIAEAIIVEKPIEQATSACTMFFTYKGRYIDSVIVGNSPIDIKSNISQFEYADISFMFTRENGYVKNSEIKRFYFERALKPASFKPTDPLVLDDINKLLAQAFVSASYENNVLKIQNVAGTTVFEAKFDTTPDLWTNTSNELTYDGDSVLLSTTQTNIKTLQTRLTTLLMKLADETNAGLMSSATVKAISDLISRVDSLEARSVRLLYTESENPTAEDIENFVKAQGYSYPYGGIAVVVDKTYHIWHAYEDYKTSLMVAATYLDKRLISAIPYSSEITVGFPNYIGVIKVPVEDSYDTLEADITIDTVSSEMSYLTGKIGLTGDDNIIKEESWFPGPISILGGSQYEFESLGYGVVWKDDGQDTVSQFTNNVAGIIKGSNIDGKVYAEDDGTGSVKGWDELKTLVQTLLTNLNNKLDKDTSSLGYGRVYGVTSTGSQVMRKITENPRPETMMYRNASGDCKIQDPVNPESIANKRYVDNKVPTISQTTGDSTTAVMSQSAVTTQLDNKASKSELSQYVPVIIDQQPSGANDAMFFYAQTPGSEQEPSLMFGESGLEAETYESQPTVMIRDANHRSQIEDPVNEKDIANKKYVDTTIESNKVVIVQSTGQSTTSTMSQKAITDSINAITADSLGAATTIYVDNQIQSALGTVEAQLSEV